MRLDRAQTKLQIDGGLFQATLDSTSPDSITGNDTELLQFEAQPVSALIQDNPPVEVHLYWEENGADSSTVITLPPGQLTVQDPGALQVLSVTPSQSTVTIAQSKQWSITVEVRNNGQAPVDIDLGATSTYLTLETLSGLPVGGYTFRQPSQLEGIGGTVLPGNQTTADLVFAVTGTGTTTGPIRVTAMVEGVDTISSQPDSAQGGGGFTAQEAADIHIDGIALQQNTATLGQQRDYDIALTVRNDGDARAHIRLHEDSTQIAFAPPDTSWLLNLQTEFDETGTVIPGGQTRTIRVTVDQTGATSGLAEIAALIRSIDINSDSLMVTAGAALDTILVQNPALVQITGVSVSQEAVTQETPKNWSITATVSNTGEADAILVPGSLDVTIQDDLTTVIDPAEILGGDPSLPGGGGSREIQFLIRGAGTFASFGIKNIQVDVLAKEEPNSGLDRSDSDISQSVIVQDWPQQLQYVLPRFEPPQVSKGALVSFKMNVRNNSSDYATVRLDPSTRFRITGATPPYIAQLAAESPDSIVGGTTEELIFEATQIDPGITATTYPVNVFADYSHNGNTGETTTITPLADSVVVQDPSQLDILAIVPSKTTVTKGQTKSWTVTMRLQNNGVAAVILDTSQTTILFERQGTDVTDQYVVLRPALGLSTALSDTLLGGGTIDELVYEVVRADTGLGNVSIDGYVIGQDENSPDILEDDTRLTGGGANVFVQEPAVLAVTDVRAERPTVTTGQSTPWNVFVELENNGEAAVDFVASDSDLIFGNSGWNSTLVGGDFQLTGYSSRTLQFSVTQSGVAGTPTIDAYVEGVEANRDTSLIVNTTGTGPSGSILVQTRADLSIQSTNVVPLNPPNTHVNRGQTFKVAASVRNDGEATAQNIVYKLVALSSSTVPDSVTIDTIDGNTTVVDTFEVTAPIVETVDADTLITTLHRAIDANSLQELVVISSVPDSVIVSIDSSSTLVVEAVIASQSTVTQLQTEDWFLTVALSNTGDAALKLNAPQDSDLRFALTGGGTQQFDYDVVAPDTLLSGSADWIVYGGSSDAITAKLGARWEILNYRPLFRV
jgi:hypothetical protein